MTHDVLNRDYENLGSVFAEYVTIDITSLDGSGFENVAPEHIDDVLAAKIVGIGDGTLDAKWDHVNDRLHVHTPTGAHNHNVPGDSSGTTANAEFDANGNLAVGAGGSIAANSATGADPVAAGTAVGQVRIKFEGK